MLGGDERRMRDRRAHAAGRGATAMIRRPAVALALSLGALMLWSASALALSQRGHVFSFAFGGEGSGPGKFGAGGPQALAVNESTGELFVVDQANGRVERFSCTSSECTTPESGPSQLNVPGAESLVVINAKGHPHSLFVATSALVIKRFTPELSEGKVVGFKEGELKGWKEAGGPKEEFSEILGLGEFEGHLYFYEEGVVRELNGATLVKEIPAETECASRPGLALGPGETVYAAHERKNFARECEEEATVVSKFDSAGSLVNPAVNTENTTGVAVDSSTGDVYLDSVTALAAFGPSGSLIQNFAAGELARGAGIAIDAKTNTVYVADPGSNHVDVFEPAPAGLPAVNDLSSQNLTPTSERLTAEVDPSGADTHAYFQYGTADCTTEPAACTSTPLPPGNDLGSVFGDVTTSVDVTGLQPATLYNFRIVAENANGKAEKAGILHTLPSSEGLLADGREWELVSPPVKEGASVQPPGGLGGNSGSSGGIEQAATDGNSITYVMNGPAGREEPQGNRTLEGQQFVASRGEKEWASQDIVTPHEHAEGYPTVTPQEYQFFSNDLSRAIASPFGAQPRQEPPLMPEVTEEERGLYLRTDFASPGAFCVSRCYEPLVNSANDTQKEPFGGKLHFLSATADVQHAVFFSTARLTADAPEGGGLYEWAADGSLQLVSILPNGTAAESEDFGTGPELGAGNEPASATEARNYRGAISSDGTHVVWANLQRDRLYVRNVSEGKTIQINKVCKPLPEPNVCEHFEKEEEEPATELDEVFFQLGSSDGSKTFFTDTARLTPESTLHPTAAFGPDDLYVYEADRKRLTDLTALSLDGPAEVEGSVIGASKDGSTVYFVANGVLAPGAPPGNCVSGNNSAEQRCNLYMDHYNSAPGVERWETTFITSLSGADAPDWSGARENPALSRMPSRVSPEGRYLAFMSQLPLTGYNNEDANPAAAGARDEEVFLYDSASAHITCVSCAPATGANKEGRSHGVIGNGESPLVVDGTATWSNRWIAANLPGWMPLTQYIVANQPRYLSDQGRLFFDANDALVEQDTNGKMDAYQYEPSGVGSCAKTAGCVTLISSGTSNHESAFIDATSSGNDAFFLTDQALLSSDTDHAYDLYDARVCGPSGCLKPPVPVPPCANEEACRPSRTPPPSPGGSPTTSTGGLAGNAGTVETRGEKVGKKPTVKLTKKQKLERALRSCRKRYKKNKKRRLSCERSARRAYGSKSSKRGKR
jgi:DNA-binding beta-propeller fold protein YncE